MKDGEVIHMDFVPRDASKCNGNAPDAAAAAETFAEKILAEIVAVMESGLSDASKVRIARALIRFMPAEPDA